MLKRRFIGIFDLKTDAVAFATSSATYAASIGADLGSRKNLLGGILSAAGDVRSGEGLGALILTINLFTLLVAYYLLKTASGSLILAEGGAEVRACSSVAQAIVLLGIMRCVGDFGRLGQVTSIPGSTFPSLQAGGLQIQVFQSCY
jgi:ATP:ADP antiporter, AAA family